MLKSLFGKIYKLLSAYFGGEIMFKQDLVHFIRKMVDYEETELIAKYRLFERTDVPAEDLEIFKKQMDDSVRHSRMLTELLAEITKEGKNEY